MVMEKFIGLVQKENEERNKGKKRDKCFWG